MRARAQAGYLMNVRKRKGGDFKAKQSLYLPHLNSAIRTNLPSTKVQNFLRLGNGWKVRIRRKKVRLMCTDYTVLVKELLTQSTSRANLAGWTTTSEEFTIYAWALVCKNQSRAYLPGLTVLQFLGLQGRKASPSNTPRPNMLSPQKRPSNKKKDLQPASPKESEKQSLYINPATSKLDQRRLALATCGFDMTREQLEEKLIR